MGSQPQTKWRPPASLYFILDYKYCLVWVRKSDKIQQMQQYQINIHNDDQLQQYQKMFTMRLEQSYYPITMYFVNHQPKFICTDAKMGSILIQRIPYRLCQFINITHHQSISILYHSLTAYQLLHKSYGLFKIQTTMIGLDRNYKIKVWHHTDFSNPKPQYLYCQSLVQMINSIIISIQRISSKPIDGFTFTEFLSFKKIVLYNYQLTFFMIKQYAQFYKIKLSDKFQNIQKYLRGAQGELFNDNNKFDKKQKQNLLKNQHQYRCFSNHSNMSNRSLKKYSFKKNEIVQNIDPLQNNNNLKNIYNNYPNNNKQKSSQIKPFHNRQNLSHQKLYTPINKIPITPFNDQQKTLTNKININPFDDYGIQTPRTKPNHQKHTRAATQFCQSHVQQNKHVFIPYIPNRWIGQQPRISQGQKIRNANVIKSPYYKNTYTSGGAPTGKSKLPMESNHRLASAIDQENKKNAINMGKQKQQQCRRQIHYY